MLAVVGDADDVGVLEDGDRVGFGREQVAQPAPVPGVLVERAVVDQLVEERNRLGGVDVATLEALLGGLAQQVALHARVERFVHGVDDQLEREMAGGGFALQVAGEVVAIALVVLEGLVFLQQLHGHDDHAREVGVLRFPDLSHAPGAEAFQELVTVRDQGFRYDGHCVVRRGIVAKKRKRRSGLAAKRAELRCQVALYRRICGVGARGAGLAAQSRADFRRNPTLPAERRCCECRQYPLVADRAKSGR